jgi:two-component system chemotaxis response regulator CheY
MKILIVDDSRAMRMIVRRALRQAGFGHHDIAEAADGKEGLAAVESELPDIIWSDWNMPNMTGIDFLRALRADKNNTPFGFVTSEGAPEMRELAKNEGARFVIAKPFTAESFQDALTPILG